MSEITKVFNVEGMSCSHCERAIKNAMNGLDGVSSTEVDLNAKTVTVHYDTNHLDEMNLIAAIEEAGYDIV